MSAASSSSWRPASSPGSMRRCASAPGISQAELLRSRGDLQQGRTRFDAQLPKVRPIVRQTSISRIGMEVVSSKEQSGLIVSDIDKNKFGKTPVAVHNFRDERQAFRSKEEEHASYAIKPGDRIREIRAATPDRSLKDLSAILEQDDFDGKKTMSATEMFAELRAATSETSPKAVNLQVSRNLEDVLRPLINSGSLDSSQQFPAGSTQTNLTKRPASAALPPKPPTPCTPLLESSPSTTSPALQKEGQHRNGSSWHSAGARSVSPCVFRMTDDELFQMSMQPSGQGMSMRTSSRQSSARCAEADPRRSPPSQAKTE